MIIFVATLATTTLLLTLLVSPLMAVEGKGLVCKCVKSDDGFSASDYGQAKSPTINLLVYFL